MKLSKVFSAAFAGLGVILMVAAVAGCLLFRNAGPKNGGIPQAAQDCTEQFAQALMAGDYQAAESLLYGQPDLGVNVAPDGEAAKRTWEAYQGSVSCAFSGACYRKGTEIYRDMTVTALDVPGTMASLPELTQRLLDERNAGEPEEAGGAADVRQANVDAVLEDAVRLALASPKTIDYTVTLQLTQQEGRWQVIPDGALLTAISGGLG